MSTFLKIIKGARKSNTIQFNGTILAILVALQQTEFLGQNPNVAPWLGVAVTIGNILLRAKTNKPLADRADG